MLSIKKQQLFFMISQLYQSYQFWEENTNKLSNGFPFWDSLFVYIYFGFWFKVQRSNKPFNINILNFYSFFYQKIKRKSSNKLFLWESNL